MAKLAVGDQFPAATLQDIDGAYVSDSASDRPSPVALAKAAVAVASGREPPANYPGKYERAYFSHSVRYL